MQCTIMFLPILLVLGSLQAALGLYGFDCSNQPQNITSISLVEIGECGIEEPQVFTEQIYAQLLQLNDYKLTHVKKCSIKITRFITRCRYVDYTKRVNNGERVYYKEISREACEKIHAQGSYTLEKTLITDIQTNATTGKSITLMGSTDANGNCEGGTYTDSFGEWDHVYVAGYVEIAISDFYSEVKLNADKVILQSGVTCALSDTSCADSDGSTAFWSVIPESQCGFEKYSVLYEGMVNKTIEEDGSRVMYSLESEDITFALIKKADTHICGFKFARTEHPKLFMLENSQNSEFKEKGPIAASNLDIFAYMNSKFLYTEKYLKGQINRLYYDVLKSKCELEQKVIKNALAIAAVGPSEIAYYIQQKEGVMAIPGGEVIHLMECIKVEVKLRKTPECYEELPILQGEEELFLLPRSRIIVKHGTQTVCDARLPIMYKMDGTWVRLTPSTLNQKNPEIWSPKTKPTYMYQSPRNLASTGIYSERDTQRLREMIMLPAEKNAILTKLALGTTGQEFNRDHINFIPFFDKQMLETLAERTWNKIWSNFIKLGNISAAIIAIFMLLRIVKFVLDSLMHGYVLYSVYGFSIMLFAAVWKSLTHLILHLNQKTNEKVFDKIEHEKESIITSQPRATAPAEQNTIAYVYPRLPEERDSI